MSRAGLVCVYVLALLIAVVSCVPLAERTSLSSAITTPQSKNIAQAKSIRWGKDNTLSFVPSVRHQTSPVNLIGVDNSDNVVALYPRFLDKILGKAFKKAEERIKSGFQTAGQRIKQGFQNAGQKIKQGFETAGHRMRQGFQTAGRAIKHGFQKAGHWIKENGLKVVKLGLKAVATIKKVASHVVRFIPGVGTALSAGLDAASMATNAAADAVPAKLTGNWAKANTIMGHIQNPFGLAVKKGAAATRKAAPRIAGRVANKRGTQARAPIRRPSARAFRGVPSSRSAARGRSTAGASRGFSAIRSAARRGAKGASRPVIAGGARQLLKKPTRSAFGGVAGKTILRLPQRRIARTASRLPQRLFASKPRQMGARLPQRHVVSGAAKRTTGRPVLRRPFLQRIVSAAAKRPAARPQSRPPAAHQQKPRARAPPPRRAVPRSAPTRGKRRP